MEKRGRKAWKKESYKEQGRNEGKREGRGEGEKKENCFIDCKLHPKFKMLKCD
jgi:hypothetical protein